MTGNYGTLKRYCAVKQIWTDARWTIRKCIGARDARAVTELAGRHRCRTDGVQIGKTSPTDPAPSWHMRFSYKISHKTKSGDQHREIQSLNFKTRRHPVRNVTARQYWGDVGCQHWPAVTFPLWNPMRNRRNSESLFIWELLMCQKIAMQHEAFPQPYPEWLHMCIHAYMHASIDSRLQVLAFNELRALRGRKPAVKPDWSPACVRARPAYECAWETAVLKLTRSLSRGKAFPLETAVARLVCICLFVFCSPRLVWRSGGV